MQRHKVRADFNGLFGQVLCLSHEDTCLDEHGAVVRLREGLALIAFDDNVDENGNRDDLVAEGKVEPAPRWLQCNGSKWVLMIDENGVRQESDLRRTESTELT